MVIRRPLHRTPVTRNSGDSKTGGGGFGSPGPGPGSVPVRSIAISGVIT
jgi:hypothetical protein